MLGEGDLVDAADARAASTAGASHPRVDLIWPAIGARRTWDGFLVLAALTCGAVLALRHGHRQCRCGSTAVQVADLESTCRNVLPIKEPPSKARANVAIRTQSQTRVPRLVWELPSCAKARLKTLTGSGITQMAALQRARANRQVIRCAPQRAIAGASTSPTRHAR